MGLDFEKVRSANSVLQVVDMTSDKQRHALGDLIASTALVTAVKTIRNAPISVDIMVVGRDGVCWGTARG